MKEHDEGLLGEVISVSRSETHTFSKQIVDAIRLLAGLGVEGDAHMGRTVKHRSRVAQNPDQPNLRQARSWIKMTTASLFEKQGLWGSLWQGERCEPEIRSGSNCRRRLIGR